MPLPADLRVQSLDAPLNENARKALQDLTRRYQNENNLQEKLKESTKLIIEATGTLNDRAHDRRVRYSRHVKKQAEKGEEEDKDETREHDEFQRKADELTKKMDLSMRRIIDNRIWAEELPANISMVNTNSINSSIRAAAQPTQADDDDDNDTPPMPALPPDETPSSLLHAALSTQTAHWTSKSLTDRYADDDDYKSFHKTLWDAKHPEENAPLMPAPALWLDCEEQSGNPLSRASQSSQSQDVDLAIASERVSLKCPITLQYFRDPVTASTCNHSFEQTAILNMLKTSTDTIPLNPAQLTHLASLPRTDRSRTEHQMKLKRVRCPECNKWLSEKELKPNPVLLRRVQRKIEQERREQERRENEDEDEEESDDEMQGPRGTQRLPVGVGSSPAREGERVRSEAERVKSERISGVSRLSVRESDGDLPSGTQRTTAEGATMMDLDDDGDE